jgi:3D (Asp-Asp-Asp) domain-containing protein
MIRLLLSFSLAALVFLARDFWQAPSIIVEASSDPISTVPYTQPIITESKFKEKLEETAEVIPREIIVTDDPEVEYGEEKTLTEGTDGKKVKITRVTYYLGEEYSRDVVSTDITPAENKKISRGTKIVWRILDTPDGTISYWRKMRVYATHYDSHCPGCNDWTAIGMRAGKGVIAVDPKVIKLRSKVYVPGYGLAVAGDTGGAIKGNIIDLGFEDARTAGWYAHFIDIYLL